MIGDYLKQAAAQLRRAALARKDETSSIRRDVSNRENDVKKMIDSLRKVIDQRKREMNTANDSSVKAAIMAEVSKLEQEIKTIQTDFEREKQRISQEVQWKEGQVEVLNSQAGDFEKQASLN